MFQKYHQDVEIMLVYIREAHAIDGASPMASVLVEEPVTDAERRAVANSCVADLQLEMIPAVIDRIDNKVDAAYQGRPDRLYLVGKDGRIAYAGARGPRGFRPAELIAAIDRELAEITNRQAKKKSPK